MLRKVVNDKDEIIAKTDNNASIKKYVIFVKSISKPQINESKIVYSNRPLLVLEGKKVITIYAEERKYDINVSIHFEDTNIEVLKKISKAINDKNIDITAQVIKISGVISRLQIKSKYSGLKNNFYIEDKIGRLVCEYDLDNIVCKAQNLNCIINDEYYELKNNSIILDNGKLKITFKKLTEGCTILIVKQNVKEIINDINNFFDSYNKLIDILPYCKKVKLSLDTIRKFINKNKLDNIGIALDENFKIKFEQDIFTKVLKNKNKYTENLIRGKNGITKIIYNFANYILNNLFDIIGVKGFKVYSLYANNVIKYNSGELIKYFI